MILVKTAKYPYATVTDRQTITRGIIARFWQGGGVGHRPGSHNEHDIPRYILSMAIRVHVSKKSFRTFIDVHAICYIEGQLYN